MFVNDMGGFILGTIRSILELKQEAFQKCWPIRHCEPPHAFILHCHSPGVATVARHHCCTPPAHRCPRQRVQLLCRIPPVVIAVLAEIRGERAVPPPQYKTVTVKTKWQLLHPKKVGQSSQKFFMVCYSTKPQTVQKFVAIG